MLHAQGGRLVAPDGSRLKQDLKEVGRYYAREHGAIYLVDLDGLRRNRPDLGLVQELASRCPLWADAGSRFHQDVMDLLIAGAEQVTMRYQTAKDEEALRETVRLTEHLALGMELQGGELVENSRWPATPPELASLANEFRLPLVVVDLDRAGHAEGIDKSAAWHGRAHGPGSYFAGGVASQRDLETLDSMGYHGALVATALLEGSRLEGARWQGPYGPPDEASEEASP